MANETKTISKILNEGANQRCSTVSYLYSWNSIVIPSAPNNGHLIDVQIHGSIYGNSSQGGQISYQEIESSMADDKTLHAYFIKSTGTGYGGRPTFPANTIGIDSTNVDFLSTKAGEARHLQLDIQEWRTYLTDQFGDDVTSVWLQKNGYPQEITIDFIYEIVEPIQTYQISTVLTHVKGNSSNPTTINSNESALLTFTANSGYRLPNTVNVQGASIVSWNKTTGKLTIDKPTKAVSIGIIGEKIPTPPPTPTGTEKVYVGGTKIADAKVGNSQVNKIYLGSTLVWEKYTGPAKMFTPLKVGQTYDHINFNPNLTMVELTPILQEANLTGATVIYGRNSNGDAFIGYEGSLDGSGNLYIMYTDETDYDQVYSGTQSNYQFTLPFTIIAPTTQQQLDLFAEKFCGISKEPETFFKPLKRGMTGVSISINKAISKQEVIQTFQTLFAIENRPIVVNTGIGNQHIDWVNNRLQAVHPQIGNGHGQPPLFTAEGGWSPFATSDLPGTWNITASSWSDESLAKLANIIGIKK